MCVCTQVEDFLRALDKERNQDDDHAERDPGMSEEVLENAMQEAEEAANRVLSGETSIKLTPQRSYVRRLQHLLGHRYNVASTSQGREPQRSVMFYKA